MLLTKSSEYALRSVLYLASKFDKGTRLGTKTIASDLNLPEHFLGKILQKLVRKKIISSIKGRNGGFFIEKDALKMPVINVIEAIDGIDSFHACGLGLPQCNDEKPCPIHKDYGTLRDGFFKILSEKSIEDYKNDIDSGVSFI